MRKLFITTLIAVSIFTSAFASPIKEVNINVTRAFETSFPSVTDVKWVVTQDYTKAVFVYNKVNTEAYYNNIGEFIGVIHAISLSELPTFAKRTFAKKYGDYVVKEAIALNGEQEMAYFISAENEKESVILKVVDGTLSTFKTTSKVR